MVHLVNGNYRIAVMDMGRKDILVLSAGNQDESPSFAPLTHLNDAGNSFLRQQVRYSI